MISVSYGSDVPVPVFSVPETDPNYWSLRADYEYTITMQALRSAGIEITQQESADIEAVLTSLNTDLSVWTSAYEAWLVDKGVGFMANLIDLAPVITMIASGGSADALSILIGFCINMLMQSQSPAARLADEHASDIEEAVREGSGLPDTLHISINNNWRDDDDALWSVVDSPPSP